MQKRSDRFEEKEKEMELPGYDDIHVGKLFSQ